MREITLTELRSCDYVGTMGCSTLDFGDVGVVVDIRDVNPPHSPLAQL